MAASSSSSPGKGDIWSMKKSLKLERNVARFRMRNRMISCFSFFFFFFYFFFFFDFLSGWSWSSREKTLIPCVTGMRRPVDSSKRQHLNKKKTSSLFSFCFFLHSNFSTTQRRRRRLLYYASSRFFFPFENSNKKSFREDPFFFHSKKTRKSRWRRRRRKQTGFTIATESSLGQDEKNFVSPLINFFVLSVEQRKSFCLEPGISRQWDTIRFSSLIFHPGVEMRSRRGYAMSCT